MNHDFLAMGLNRHVDAYEIGELEASNATKLDTTGMQPHSREFLERDIQGIVSGRRFHEVDGQTIDYCEGIHFGDTP